MIGRPSAKRGVKLAWRLAGAFLLVFTWSVGAASGQTGPAAGPSQPAKLFLSADEVTAPEAPSGIQQTGCSSCSAGGLAGPVSSCSSCA